MAGEQNLWLNVSSEQALNLAWAKVAANEGSAGGDGVTLRDFASSLFANIVQLRAELLGGSFRSGPYRQVAMPKTKGGYRVLTIPPVRDRVVHTSIAAALTPIFEAVFEDSSFAYRPGRGVVHAVERIQQWHQQGYDFVVEADIVRYFDNIAHDLLFEKLHHILDPLPGAAPVLALIERIVAEQGSELGTPSCGLAQGSPLSPLLANTFLGSLDEEMDSNGVKLVRFADDFVVLCKTEARAEKALDHCIRILDAHQLQLHAEGTRIVSFDKGFDFIGYLFLCSLALKKDRPVEDAAIAAGHGKLPIADDGVVALEDAGSRYDPGARVLYVLDPTHRIGRRNQSFSVMREDASELVALPHRRIGRIELGPNVVYDRQAIELALDKGIEIAFIDGFGQTRGTLASSEGKRAGVHLAQARGILNEAVRVAIARQLVDARMRNQRTQLMRLARDRQVPEVPFVLSAMMGSLKKLPTVITIDGLLGQEGSATAQYWKALGKLVSPAIADFRRSRPASDPMNAAINYLTGILERDIRASIQGVALLPGLAFLHGTRDRHDGLVYDLMEPFRAPLTEGLAVFLFNASRLRAEMFVENATGIEISDIGRKALVQGYESAVARRVNAPRGGGKLAWRPLMRAQAQSLVNALIALQSDLFMPYLMEV